MDKTGNLLKIEMNSKKLKNDFENLQKSGKSILTTTVKYIEFGGLLENGDRSCVHLDITNPTESTMIFNIRSPGAPCFFVKPMVGKIDSKSSTKLYFTFKARCHRVPDDFSWIYSIYQLKLADTQENWVKEDEFSTQRVRSIWKEHGAKPVDNILHLAVLFVEKTTENKECTRHFPNQMIIVNDAGEVMAEEVPDLEDVAKNDDDELPPTAEE